MNVVYKISPKATEDLEQIWLYTYFNWSEKQADKYYNLLISKIEFIAQNFTTGHKINYIKADYRCLPVESHIIFYRMSSDGTVEIIRILHQNMDIPNRLKYETI
jgi:toxin ParE1/3/4